MWTSTLLRKLNANTNIRSDVADMFPCRPTDCPSFPTKQHSTRAKSRADAATMKASLVLPQCYVLRKIITTHTWFSPQRVISASLENISQCVVRKQKTGKFFFFRELRRASADLAAERGRRPQERRVGRPRLSKGEDTSQSDYSSTPPESMNAAN